MFFSFSNTLFFLNSILKTGGAGIVGWVEYPFADLFDYFVLDDLGKYRSRCKLYAATGNKAVTLNCK